MSALNDIGYGLRQLRDMADRGYGSPIWSPGKELHMELTVANDLQLHCLRAAILREAGPLYEDFDPKELRVEDYQFKGELCAVPFRVSIRRERHEIVRDIEVAQQMLRRVRSGV